MRVSIERFSANRARTKAASHGGIKLYHWKEILLKSLTLSREISTSWGGRAAIINIAIWDSTLRPG